MSRFSQLRDWGTIESTRNQVHEGEYCQVTSACVRDPLSNDCELLDAEEWLIFTDLRRYSLSVCLSVSFSLCLCFFSFFTRWPCLLLVKSPLSFSWIGRFQSSFGPATEFWFYFWFFYKRSPIFWHKALFDRTIETVYCIASWLYSQESLPAYFIRFFISFFFWLRTLLFCSSLSQLYSRIPS